MKAFMDKEFMLQSPTAQHLYHAYAEDMPICDYHCHIPPREIYAVSYTHLTLPTNSLV